MREIKFRAWDKDYKYMNYKVMVGNVWDEENYHAHMIWVDRKDVDYECESGWMNFDEHSNNEIMQYTGLKDKNGVEIYEGDILSTDLDRPYLIVEFRNGAFMFQCHDNGKDYYDFMATTGENSNFTKYHEVIGNIYENRKLLGRDGE